MAAGLTARLSARRNSGPPATRGRSTAPGRSGSPGPLSVPDQGKNDTPSSEVKHWALEKLLPSASTLTTPLCWMNSRPLVALHRSTLTKTLVLGRNAAGRVKGTALVPEVAIAPLK